MFVLWPFDMAHSLVRAGRCSAQVHGEQVPVSVVCILSMARSRVVKHVACCAPHSLIHKAEANLAGGPGRATKTWIQIEKKALGETLTISGGIGSTVVAVPGDHMIHTNQSQLTWGRRENLSSTDRRRQRVGSGPRKPRPIGRSHSSAMEVEDGARRADVQTVVIDYYDQFKEPYFQNPRFGFRLLVVAVLQ
jgi:hypothetical protein